MEAGGSRRSGQELSVYASTIKALNWTIRVEALVDLAE